MLTKVIVKLFSDPFKGQMKPLGGGGGERDPFNLFIVSCNLRSIHVCKNGKVSNIGLIGRIAQGLADDSLKVIIF